MKSQSLQNLVRTVNSTGGVLRLPNGHIVPKADEDWADLKDVYLEACQELGVEPVIDVETHLLDDC